MSGQDALVAQLENVNAGLKLKLGEVSRALLVATEQTAAAEFKAKQSAEWVKSNGGRAGRISTEGERKLRRVNLEINELHQVNERLHLKTDSVVLSNKLQQLEQNITGMNGQIQQLMAENNAVRGANYKGDIAAERNLKGAGAKHAFERDYRYAAQENSAVALKVKTTNQQSEKLATLSEKQDFKLSVLANEIALSGKDPGVVKEVLKVSDEVVSEAPPFYITYSTLLSRFHTAGATEEGT